MDATLDLRTEAAELWNGTDDTLWQDDDSEVIAKLTKLLDDVSHILVRSFKLHVPQETSTSKNHVLGFVKSATSKAPVEAEQPMRRTN